jgi:hypothetical protein
VYCLTILVKIVNIYKQKNAILGDIIFADISLQYLFFNKNKAMENIRLSFYKRIETYKTPDTINFIKNQSHLLWSKEKRK